MSCHDIGRGMNSVTKEIIKLYDASQIARDPARKLIIAARKGVNWCDGNEGEAVACISHSRCGHCLTKIEPGKPLYSLFDTTLSYSDVWELEEERSDWMVHDRFCRECFDKIMNDYRNDPTAGERERKYIEEHADPEQWQAEEENL